MKNNDDYFKRLSAMEQAAAAMRPIAGIIGSYFNALVENGLSRDEALILTKEYQALFFGISIQNQMLESLKKESENKKNSENEEY